MMAGQQMQRRNRNLGGMGNHIAKLVERPRIIDTATTPSQNNDLNHEPETYYQDFGHQHESKEMQDAHAEINKPSIRDLSGLTHPDNEDRNRSHTDATAFLQTPLHLHDH